MTTCEDCKGSGVYIGIGLFPASPCRRCEGQGTTPEPSEPRAPTERMRFPLMIRPNAERIPIGEIGDDDVVRTELRSPDGVLCVFKSRHDQQHSMLAVVDGAVTLQPEARAAGWRIEAAKVEPVIYTIADWQKNHGTWTRPIVDHCGPDLPPMFARHELWAACIECDCPARDTAVVQVDFDAMQHMRLTTLRGRIHVENVPYEAAKDLADAWVAIGLDHPYP